jgi:ABC-type lipoprotein export system ATPase subunit
MNKLIGKNIVREYPGGVRALNGVSIEVEKGDISLIMGPSGSGKTTLLNILGLLDKPTEGSVFIDDKDITNLEEGKSTKLMNRTFGFIFQFFYLIPELSVVENVMLPLWIRDKTSLKLKEYYNKADKLLKEFGMFHRRNFFSHQLSGGELQRAAICRSLICEPKIIFADEPTGSIDRKSSEMFFNLIKELNEQKGVTFIIGTHNEKFMELATKTIFLNQGEVEKVI